MNKAKEFVNAYNRLLEEMAACNPTDLFWATDFASKNRFSCPLPDMLEQLVAKGRISKLQSNVRYKRLVGVFYHALKIFIRMCKARRAIKSLNHGHGYIVVKTFIYNHSFDAQGQYKDVFWGELPQQLKTKGQVLILGTILGDYDECLRRCATCKEFTIVPLEAFLSFSDLLEAVWKELITSIHVPDHLDFMGHEVSAMVRRYFYCTFKGVKLAQFLQFWVAHRLAQKIRIQKFYMTYENYPWERMMVMALRQSNQKIPIIGYQHTVVPQSFLNYFVSSIEKQDNLLPDQILTTGKQSKDIIQQYSSISIDLQAACALRFEYLYKHTLSPRRSIGHILLALEGSYIIEPMVQFVFKQLAGMKDYQLKIRTHPLLPWEVLENRLGLKVGNFDNVEISESNLNEDLQWADTIIYCSSTVSMEALMMGKPVIHIAMNSVLSFDPLFECQELKKSVSLNQNLMEALKAIETMPDEQFYAQQRKARGYLESYLSPVSKENLSVFLN